MKKDTPARNEQHRENRRVRYTRMALRESLLSLLQQYPLNKITVSRICEQADVNRSTFYLYYKDAYDLLEQIENELYDRITQTVEDIPLGLPNQDLLQRIFEIIYKNRDLCRVIFGEYGDKKFLRRVGNIQRDYLLREWRRLARDADDMTLDYLHTYASFTTIGLIEKWVVRDFHETPSQLASLANKLLNHGITALLTRQPQ
ncbi:MAG: TetR-like C-terminal domain-containing protein [Eubacteriales bacterium]|jgi:AcrR family transcriptional regulator|nr:TetR-like C-terminal domain-containing protein [Eubacteriales bacterium]MDD3109832.1 TetR-like C-terminal domain-containing protein [Eubacteriales bacterium]MDD3572459.1 TetR-like C-terminal domain-containing protein [Eubacteriales bacterium]MDD4135244.1 TetR-like C-terminal domain-containing protein [Eubacteriales bacterium]NLO13968.1 TetR/AcrR family transcriptional regulator [Clostridiales bacterium]